MNDPYYNRVGDTPTSQDNPSPAWWATQRGGPGAGMPYLAGGPMQQIENDYMWNTLGIRDWIVQGDHMTDDWILSSCLSGMKPLQPRIPHGLGSVINYLTIRSDGASALSQRIS